jgi:hypothetical protein
MAATADIRNILEKVLIPEGFAELPSPGLRATKWWKQIPLPSNPERHAALIITVIPGRRLGDFTVIPDIRLDAKRFAEQNRPSTFFGSLHDWVHLHLGTMPVLCEIEDFYNREEI